MEGYMGEIQIISQFIYVTSLPLVAHVGGKCNWGVFFGDCLIISVIATLV